MSSSICRTCSVTWRSQRSEKCASVNSASLAMESWNTSSLMLPCRLLAPGLSRCPWESAGPSPPANLAGQKGTVLATVAFTDLHLAGQAKRVLPYTAHEKSATTVSSVHPTAEQPMMPTVTVHQPHMTIGWRWQPKLG